MQTDPSAQLLIALLRAQLGTAAEPGAEQFARCDAEYLERLAAHHGVTPILYQGLRERAELVPAERLQHMRLSYHGNALRNWIVEGLVDEIAAALSAARIAVILLKGAALLRTVYDDPALRRVSDIDLLVDERDLDRAGAQLCTLGLAGYGARRGPLCRIHVRYTRPTLQSIPVELHWRLFEGYQPYAFDLAEVQARARSLPDMPPGVFAMSPEHELAHLCLHLERRAMVYRSLIRRDDWFDLLVMPQGLGRLVWLYDIALSLQHRASVLDWDALVAMARQWAIDEHLHAVFELCQRALGVGPPPTVLAALHRGGPRLADRLAHRVVFASRRALTASPEPPLGGTDWATALAPSVLRLAHTWSIVFPPPAYLRTTYPTLRSALRRYAQHLQVVTPGLWSEMRERFAGGATRGKSVPKGILINAAWGTWYPRGSQRLERSLVHHGWEHEMKFWRNETINSFFDPAFPYTIKAAAVAQALWDGYTHILWMDCQLWVTGNPNVLMHYIDNEGGLFIRSGFNLAQTADDNDLAFANINRDEAESLPELWSCVFGFNINTRQGKTFAHWFLDAAKNGVFSTSRLHANGSRDKRYLFARQDQTAATIAYHKAGYDIMKDPGDLLGDYSKDSDKLIYRRGM